MKSFRPVLLILLLTPALTGCLTLTTAGLYEWNQDARYHKFEATECDAIHREHDAVRVHARSILEDGSESPWRPWLEIDGVERRADWMWIHELSSSGPGTAVVSWYQPRLSQHSFGPRVEVNLSEHVGTPFLRFHQYDKETRLDVGVVIDKGRLRQQDSASRGRVASGRVLPWVAWPFCAVLLGTAAVIESPILIPILIALKDVN